ncbi:MAG TPA: prepilin-type N-terminal cleavage/methylation domain-containing protein [Candidatus Spyradenecus faecavium]|uniref:Prepilin-type N-terminal cleavage/methylation domain-containing protein n=1 Tax=Candidatus Spyradenecus faecavium TaxID=2840947 RepID=A0A9D1T2P7_9BACT|nr:prepilin-type N-terminal cleavage/methylation domain-containing protein [Candidatus Spyradenecus faecavium]
MARTRLCGKGGFTLIEILAVVVIMAILAGGVFMMMGAGDSKSKIAETNAQIQALSSLLEEYKNQYGEYPLVTNVDDQGYAALNFTFKVEDGGSCNECGNQPSSDKIAFGLASRFIPTATTIYQKCANTNMESHYKRCYSDPSGQDSEAWERELGASGADWQDIMGREAGDSNLDQINRSWRRLEKEGLLYSGVSACPYCNTRTYSAGASNDAWDRGLKYNTATKAIVSAGPDGKFGTDDDISGSGTGTEDED